MTYSPPSSVSSRACFKGSQLRHVQYCDVDFFPASLGEANSQKRDSVLDPIVSSIIQGIVDGYADRHQSQYLSHLLYSPSISTLANTQKRDDILDTIESLIQSILNGYVSQCQSCFLASSSPTRPLGLLPQTLRSAMGLTTSWIRSRRRSTGSCEPIASPLRLTVSIQRGWFQGREARRHQ